MNLKKISSVFIICCLLLSTSVPSFASAPQEYPHILFEKLEGLFTGHVSEYTLTDFDGRIITLEFYSRNISKYNSGNYELILNDFTSTVKSMLRDRIISQISLFDSDNEYVVRNFDHVEWLEDGHSLYTYISYTMRCKYVISRDYQMIISANRPELYGVYYFYNHSPFHHEPVLTKINRKIPYIYNNDQLVRFEMELEISFYYSDDQFDGALYETAVHTLGI